MELIPRGATKMQQALDALNASGVGERSAGLPVAVGVKRSFLFKHSLKRASK